MKQYLYDIFQTSSKNQCADLTIALAMFLSDARKGEQQYGPDGVDYEALKANAPILMETEDELRRFMGRHYNELVKAYHAKDRTVFNETVALCVAADKAAEEEQGE